VEARHAGTGSHRLIEGAAHRPTLARRAALALATAALASLALAAPAQADTTIGQTGFDLGVPCPNADAVIGDTNYVVPPGGGTITSFSFQSVPEHNEGQQLDFLVLRQAEGSDYTVVGETGIETLAGTGSVESFRASIAVKGGDILGIWVGAAGVTACFHHAATTGGAIQSRGFVFHPNVGVTVSLPGGPQTDLDLNLSANLVPPRCQGQDATIVGTGRGDKLRGTKGDDVIAAGGGDDRVVGLGGDDLVCGGAGADVIRGKGGKDELRGGRGKDELRGGGGADRCRGGGGSDRRHHCE
jgi:Ca2+-binding RTX toxin-like protein